MKRSTGAERTQLLLATAAVLLPFLLALAWGTHFSDPVYYLLDAARGMLGDAGTAVQSVGTFAAPAAGSALFAFIVALISEVGLDSALVALLLSAAGWSAAALVIFRVGRQLQRGWGGAVSTLLLGFNPLIIPTLGGPASWIVASIWLALASLLRRRWWLVLLALVLLITLLLPWPVNGSWRHALAYLAPISWSILLFAAGVGVDWLAAQLHRQDRARVSYQRMAGFLVSAALLVVGSWQVIIIWQLFQARPVQLWALEEAAAAWLAGEMQNSDTLLARARTGFLTGRPVAMLPGGSPKEKASAIESKLQEANVTYVVTSSELPWQQLQASVWFRLNYERVKSFRSAYVPQSPLTVWSYREPLADAGPRYAINARVPDRLWILGYQIGPQEVEPGDTVQMVLYIQAPEATAENRTPFQVVVRLISPTDFSTVREWTVDLPQNISVDQWAAGEVIVEKFPLQLPEQLEIGAYLLNLSLLGPESDEFWPVSLDNDINRLDRFPTSYVIVPPQEELTGVQPIGASYGDQIRLAGYTAGEALPGQELAVTLIWEVDHPLRDDYVAFVHLINAEGALVANHDGVPRNGRFPTRAWQPGIAVPDTHLIPLPPDLPPGDYSLKAGLYEPDSGERLAATNPDGTLAEDNAITIKTITIP